MTPFCKQGKSRHDIFAALLVVALAIPCLLIYAPNLNPLQRFDIARIVNVFQDTPLSEKNTSLAEKNTSLSETRVNTAQQESDVALRFLRRRVHLRKMCSNSNYTDTPEPYNPYHFLSLVMSQSLLWCRIAKVGTTFMKSKFNPVGDGIIQARPRDGSIPELVNKHKSFFFVREPYSRLVSGYLDKVLVTPDRWLTIGHRIISTQRPGATKQEALCGSDATFPEFIGFVLDAETRKKYRNKHFMPMHVICGACRHDYDFVGHLESIREDLDYIVDSAGASFEADFGRNDTSSIVAKFRYVFATHRKLVRRCLGDWTMMKRVWWDFQARGMIHVSFEIPASREDVENASWKQLAALVLRAHEKTLLLGKDRLKEQKRSMLLKLFAQVPLETRLKFAQVFAGDFELFGYNPMPADIYPEIPVVG